jgi:exodeoxyribonuclease-3
LKRIEYKKQFNDALLSFMNSLRTDKAVVLCGDLNVAHKPIDLANPKENKNNPGYSQSERDWIEKVLNSGYVDTFREFNNEPEQYTWWSYRFNAREKNIGWRIDYFLLDSNSRGRLINAQIHNEIFGSDHCPVSIYYK